MSESSYFDWLTTATPTTWWHDSADPEELSRGLGLHAVGRKPAVVDDRVVIRDMGNLSLSMDHRVVDGAVGADFLYALIERLQSPADWLAEGDLR